MVEGNLGFMEHLHSDPCRAAWAIGDVLNRTALQLDHRPFATSRFDAGQGRAAWDAAAVDRVERQNAGSHALFLAAGRPPKHRTGQPGRRWYCGCACKSGY
jgi:hypothetical protein